MSIRVFLVAFMILAQAVLISVANADKPQPYLSHIDMYGTSEQLADKILKKYDAQLKTLYQELNKIVLSDPDNPNDVVKELANTIKNDLLGEGYFSYINISSVFFPDDNGLYITLDVIEKNDNTRNRFTKPPSETIEDKSGLITAWIEYEKKGWELFKQGKVSLGITDCSAYHCTFGFENEELKSYLHKFDKAEQHEKLLVDILTNDADPEKRAVVPFLIGHFNNHEKIIELLTPALDDTDDTVRNNALRVIISTIMKVEYPEMPIEHSSTPDKPNDGDRNYVTQVVVPPIVSKRNQSLNLPIKRIIKAINDPTAVDRAKALIILYEVVNKDKKCHQYVKSYAGQTLVNLLKLKQPGNHMGAYMVLKEISGEDYDEWDISSWEKWISS